MFKVLPCECGNRDFLITPHAINCKRCYRSYSFNDIKKMRKNYKKIQAEIDNENNNNNNNNKKK